MFVVLCVYGVIRNIFSDFKTDNSDFFYTLSWISTFVLNNKEVVW
jgi:hypothetical protein